MELSAHVTAREVTIEQETPIVLRLEAEPGLTDVEVVRSQPAGARSYRNLAIDARILAILRQDGGADEPSTFSISSTGERQE